MKSLMVTASLTYHINCRLMTYQQLGAYLETTACRRDTERLIDDPLFDLNIYLGAYARFITCDI